MSKVHQADVPTIREMKGRMTMSALCAALAGRFTRDEVSMILTKIAAENDDVSAAAKANDALFIMRNKGVVHRNSMPPSRHWLRWRVA
jgi:hypothetical protein